jgi:hypothetical protein
VEEMMRMVKDMWVVEKEMKSSKVLMVMVMVLNTLTMVVVVVVWMKEMETNKLVMRV